MLTEDKGRLIEHIRALHGDNLIEIDALKMTPDEAEQFANDLRIIARWVRRAQKKGRGKISGQCTLFGERNTRIFHRCSLRKGESRQV